MAGTRKLETVDPEIASLALTLLARFATDAPDKTPLDLELARGLAGMPAGQAVAAKMVQNFGSIPVQKRREVFGDRAEVAYDRGAIDARLSGPPRSSNFHTLRVIAGRATIPTGLRTAATDANTAPVPPEIFVTTVDPDQQFRLTYKGLYCKEETNWDGATNSDEIYLITTVIGVDDNGQNVVRTERHPLTTTCYSDVDTGESRVGPVAAVWQGKNEPISLMVHCFEHDYGDPNKYKAEIELAARVLLIARATPS